MQIILKQRDIEQALKGYMVAQGINLYNKEVSVQFSAGRGANGISAEVNIEDGPEVLISAPPGGVINTRELQPAASVISSISERAFIAQAVAETPAELPVDVVEADPEVQAEAAESEAAPEETPAPAPVPSGSSLFS